MRSQPLRRTPRVLSWCRIRARNRGGLLDSRDRPDGAPFDGTSDVAALRQRQGVAFDLELVHLVALGFITTGILATTGRMVTWLPENLYAPALPIIGP